uniref:Cytochrome b561 n=2 Tax=Lygus hesperus TaxID=30085 RepID=A0A0K8SI85_LYGHE
MSRMFLFWVSQVLGVLLSVLTLTWIFKHRNGFSWSSDPQRQFSWHPTFMVIGMVYLFSHGIVIFRIFPEMKKWPLKLIHMGINLAAGGMGGFALYAIIDERNTTGKDHFQSLHSWIGIGALALFALQWVGGVLLFLIPCSPKWLRSRAISWHILIGGAIFILSVIATVTGIKDSSGKGDKEEKTLLNVMGIFIIVSLLFHLYILAKASYRHPSSPPTTRPPSVGFRSS